MVDSPCSLVTGEYGWAANMERIMRAQAMAKKTMELNPTHPIVKALKTKFSEDASDKSSKDLVMLLYETSILTSGFSLEDPSSFSGRIHKLIRLGLSINDGDDVVDDDDDDSEDDPPQLENEDLATMED